MLVQQIDFSHRPFAEAASCPKDAGAMSDTGNKMRRTAVAVTAALSIKGPEIATRSTGAHAQHLRPS